VNEPMATWAEVWPVAADAQGIWLLHDPEAEFKGMRAAGQEPVPADSTVHYCAESVVRRYGLPRAIVLHSTSWRQDGPRLLATYMAVIPPEDYVRATYPEAVPVPTRLLDVTGNPTPHRADEPPAPRDLDVLYHGLRHLAYLVGPEGDVNIRGALEGTAWMAHLAELRPALATMYREPA
jgi:hypothetical protein